MIPKDYITHWRTHAPWAIDAQVEQDLVICRALIELFSVSHLSDSLTFRGGTALYKLHFTSSARYSEDIDLVQVLPEPIGETLDLARSVLDPWLGEPQRQLKQGRANLIYRYESEDVPPLRMRLKIEINTREHFTELGRKQLPFEVDSPWFQGKADVPILALDELLGTKLRALYQRKKGRDLFDLWHALESTSANSAVLVACFHRYMTEGGFTVTRAQFEENLAGKRADHDFREDVEPLLRSGVSWDFDQAMDTVLELVVARLPGDAWKGLP